MLKRIITFIVLLSCTSLTLFAETPKQEEITIKDVFLGHTYELDGKRLPLKTVEQMISIDNEAITAYNRGKKFYYSSMVFAGVGGYLMGYPLGQSLGGEEPNWAMFGVGAGTVVVALVISTFADKHFENGVVIFNHNLKIQL